MNSKKLFYKFVVFVFWISIAFALSFVDQINAQKASQNITVNPDSSFGLDQDYMRLRGLERDKKESREPLRTAGNVMLFVPRTLIDGILYSAGYGALLVDDSKFINKVENIFYLYGKQLGWYPLASLSSGSQPAIGATLFYRRKSLGLSLGGYYGDNELWSSKIKLLYVFLKGNTVWKINIAARIKKRNDYEFYGFGSNPIKDPRNSFQPNASGEFGVFTQQLTRIQTVVGMRPSQKWEFFYTGFYQERRIKNPDDEDKDNLENVFDTSTIPGTQVGKENIGKQVYNEIAARFDSRKYRGQISPGIKVEGYAGVSLGVSDDESRFSRAGTDIAFYIPVIKQTRLIVPRAILDVMDNLNDDAPISFADFPRQPAFHGVSSRTLLRTDKISLVPSLEYQWPLTFTVRAHLFADYLLVSPSLNQLTISNAPYAYGFGIDFHGVNSEFGRFTVSTGSEGIRFLFTIGLSNYKSDRTKWQ